MILLIKILVVFASVAAATSTQSQPLSLECMGAGRSGGFPYGDYKIDKIRYHVEVEGQQVSVLQRGYKDENICPTVAVCTVVDTKDLVQVQVLKVPNEDAMYYTLFRLNRKTLTFEARGIIDEHATWSITGRCKPRRL